MSKYKKLGKYSLWGILGVALFVLGVGIIYRVSIYPGVVRKECASQALEYVKSKSGRIYNSIDANRDYQFVYRYCFQEKGLEPEQ